MNPVSISGLLLPLPGISMALPVLVLTNPPLMVTGAFAGWRSLVMLCCTNRCPNKPILPAVRLVTTIVRGLTSAFNNSSCGVCISKIAVRKKGRSGMFHVPNSLPERHVRNRYGGLLLSAVQSSPDGRIPGGGL